MAGPIQVIPRGLLGMLQLKSGGNNPSQLNETVQPVIDLYPQYKESLAQYQPLGGIALASGAVGPNFFAPLAIIVPDNEIWWCMNYGIYTGLMPVATDDCVFAPLMRTTRVGSIRIELCPNATPMPVAPSVAAANRQKFAGASGFWMPPGSELGFFISSITAAVTVAFTGDLRYVPCHI
jgi:hypothetical protein